MMQPHEVMVSKLLPTIRARLTKILLDEYNMKQTEVAECLGITQATVSHYKTGCRGADEELLRIFPEIERCVKELAKEVAEGLPRSQQVARLTILCNDIMATNRFCRYHRKIASLDDCEVCHELGIGKRA